MAYAVFFCKLLADFVYFFCIFEGTYRKGRGEKVKAQLLGSFCRFFKPQSVAQEAAFSPFLLLFKASYGRIEFLGLKASFYNRDGIFVVAFGYQPSDFLNSVRVFLSGMYVRVIAENRNAEILRKIFKAVAAAGCTAGMKQKLRDYALFFVFCNEAVKLLLLITHKRKLSFQ